MRPVAIVQHEDSVPPGLIAEVFESTPVPFVVIEAWREVPWPTVHELGALVVMGGVMNVDELEAYPFLVRSRQLMTDALERGLPTLGVCLGSQMMARVLGAEVFRSDPRNAFFAPVELSPQGRDDEVIQPFGSGVPVLQFHEDTFKTPGDAIPLATSTSSGLDQAFRYGNNAYAVQFHFEVDEGILRGWCADIGEPAMTEEWGTSTTDLLRASDGYMQAQGAAGRELVRRWLGVAGVEG